MSVGITQAPMTLDTVAPNLHTTWFENQINAAVIEPAEVLRIVRPQIAIEQGRADGIAIRLEMAPAKAIQRQMDPNTSTRSDIGTEKSGQRQVILNA